MKPPHCKQRNSMMGTCSFGRKGTTKLLMFTVFLFIGHRNSDQLLEHYQTFVSRLGLDSHYLLHIGMDGPNVNLAFEKKLRQYFEDELGSSFLSLGSCSPYPVHTAFRKGLEALSFDLDSFFSDILSFQAL